MAVTSGEPDLLPENAEADIAAGSNVTIINQDAGEVTEIESLCMNCLKNGTTRLLFTKIPHFAERQLFPNRNHCVFMPELVISSFQCDHCGFENREVQSGAARSAFGCKYELEVKTPADLNRQVIKSDHATVTIPSVDLEIPPQTQRGRCCTVEGFISETLRALNERLLVVEECDDKVKVRAFLERLNDLLNPTSMPWIFVLDDPAGMSHIEFSSVGLTPEDDPGLHVKKYKPSQAQLHAMGFYGEGMEPDSEADRFEAVAQVSQGAATEAASNNKVSESAVAVDQKHMPRLLQSAGWNLNASMTENMSRIKQQGSVSCVASGQSQTHEAVNEVTHEQEALTFHVTCPHCGKEATQDCCEVVIPGFSKCLIMAFNCGNCGSKSNEVKPMSGYGSFGKRWELEVVEEADLNRDVLKSDTASLALPSVGIELASGTLGGVFTTIEGLLTKVREQLESTAQFFTGDSSLDDRRQRYTEVLAKLGALTTDAALRPFKLILDDPADMSGISRRYADHSVKGAVEDPLKESFSQLESPIFGKVHRRDDQLSRETYYQILYPV